MKIYRKRYISLVVAVAIILGMIVSPCGIVSQSASAATKQTSVSTKQTSAATKQTSVSTKQTSASTKKAPVATKTDAVKPKLEITSLKAAPQSCSSVKLKWKKASGVRSYRIYVYDTAKKVYREKGRTTSGEYLVKNLAKPGHVYKFAVRGYSTVNGRIVAVTSATAVNSKTVPKAPKIAELGPRSTSNTYIKWSSVTGADGYQVYRYNCSTKKWIRLAETGKPEYKDTKKTAARGYIYRVRAYMKYDGKRYYSVYSENLRTATTPKSLVKSVYYENHVLVKNVDGEYEPSYSDISYMFVRGYRLKLAKTNGCTGYAIYYQDVPDRNKADAKKAKLLGYTNSTVLDLRRASRPGYERVFWVCTYYVYGGKRYINSSKIPVTCEGNRYIYKDRKGRVTGTEEYECSAVDKQLSEVRYYTPGGRLRKYDRFQYNKKGFLCVIKTYNAAGKLIKRERWQ